MSPSSGTHLASPPSAQAWLEFHRGTLLWKCAGLTDAQLKSASVPPSTLTLLGLLRHMAEVERAWFRTRAAGIALPDLYCTDEDPDGEFDNAQRPMSEAGPRNVQGRVPGR